ncbi:MAG TPA: hypothetical protein VHT28_17455 [Silvibacterium sp.]|nr:hypothetical protein [Silvibacterium sp.]
MKTTTTKDAVTSAPGRKVKGSTPANPVAVENLAAADASVAKPKGFSAAVRVVPGSGASTHPTG